jgi:hypothetical protein
MQIFTQHQQTTSLVRGSPGAKFVEYEGINYDETTGDLFEFTQVVGTGATAVGGISTFGSVTTLLYPVAVSPGGTPTLVGPGGTLLPTSPGGAPGVLTPGGTTTTTTVVVTHGNGETDTIIDHGDGTTNAEMIFNAAAAAFPSIPDCYSMPVQVQSYQLNTAGAGGTGSSISSPAGLSELPGLPSCEHPLTTTTMHTTTIINSGGVVGAPYGNNTIINNNNK